MMIWKIIGNWSIILEIWHTRGSFVLFHFLIEKITDLPIVSREYRVIEKGVEALK